jgi:hypothetical protein
MTSGHFSREDEDDGLPVAADAPSVEAVPLEHEVVFLPQEVEGDVGVYRDEQLTIVKELKAQGVDAAYLHDADHREWLSLKGADVVVPLVVQFGISFLASGAWEIFAGLLLARFRRSRLWVKMGRTVDKGSGAETEWFEATGDADSVTNALRIFAKGGPAEPSDG